MHKLKRIIEDAEPFSKAIAGSAVVVLLGVAVLNIVEPAEHYSHALIERARDRMEWGRTANSPEPKHVIRWGHEHTLRSGTVIKSTRPVSEAQLERFSQVEDRSAALFVGYYGLRRANKPVEVRFVSISTLNDPYYFDVDGGNGIYYGRYFPSAKITYLTHQAWDDARHITHELAHHYFHSYDMELAHMQEEARARRFETYYMGFERGLTEPHQHERPLAELDPPKEGWRHDADLGREAHLRSPMFLTGRHQLWLRDAVASARVAFTHYTGAELPEEPVPVVVLRRRDLRAWGDALGVELGHGHTTRDQPAVYTSRRVFAEDGLLSHQLAHYWINQAELMLTPEEEERLAFTFERVAERVRRGEAVIAPFTGL